jgi:hypothetical protein
MAEDKRQENRLKALIQCLQNTQEDEADCAEFDREMDCLAEWVASGADPETVIKPAIESHLQNSSDCREEFETLVSILQAERDGKLDHQE